MCYACRLDTTFALPKDPSKDLLKSRASEIKEILSRLTKEASDRDRLGWDPCPIAGERAARLKEEQYEIARRL